MMTCRTLPNQYARFSFINIATLYAARKNFIFAPRASLTQALFQFTHHFTPFRSPSQHACCNSSSDSKIMNESFDSIVAIHVKTKPAQNANKAHNHIIISPHTGSLILTICTFVNWSAGAPRKYHCWLLPFESVTRM